MAVFLVETSTSYEVQGSGQTSLFGSGYNPSDFDQSHIHESPVESESFADALRL